MMDEISIHAPLAGCDLFVANKQEKTKISIHAPLAGCDFTSCACRSGFSDFNPRTPCGVRQRQCRRAGFGRNFNPRTPCGVRRWATRQILSKKSISIHAPLAGCDDAVYDASGNLYLFQSTHPLRGATKTDGRNRSGNRFQSTHPLRGATGKVKRSQKQAYISIHAPLAGCDPSPNPPAAARHYFNPRTPCGVRPVPESTSGSASLFQSTHPLRGATPSHAIVRPAIEFQSTHPLRGATFLPFVKSPVHCISIHAPLAGCDKVNQFL